MAPVPTTPFDLSHALSARVGRIGMSPIVTMLGRVRALEKAGRPPVNFCVGEPDLDTPVNIREAAWAAINRGETRYTATDGTPQLKEAIVRKFKRENGLDYTTAQIGVASGAKHVIYNALQATLNPGDEVIIPAPYWSTYPEAVLVCDGRPVLVPCGAEAGFKLHPEALERAVTARTKWLFLNSASNPSGAVYTRDELAALAQVLRRHPHVLVMSDDIYEHLVYDGLPFVTLGQVAPDLLGRTLTVNGVSKTYAMTGWRIGYAAGPEGLIKAMATVQSQSTSNPSSISQAAAVEALNGPQQVVAERRAMFQRRRDLMVERLNQASGLQCQTPRGAFFVYAGCMDLMGRTTPQGHPIKNDSDLAEYLLEQAGVAVVPGAAFGVSSFLRLSYAASLEQIEEGCRRIQRCCASLR